MIITRGFGASTVIVESVGGGMGGSVITHTEYIDRPIPIITITDIEELINDKEIIVLDVKELIII